MDMGTGKSPIPEFMGFIDRPVESVCDLLAYETSSESGSEPVSGEGSSDYNPSRECFAVIVPEDPPEGYSPSIVFIHDHNVN